MNEMLEALIKLPGNYGLSQHLPEDPVLVSGGCILTAAHCIEFTCKGAMVLGDVFIEEIETKDRRLKVSVLAVDPVCDIAVLGAVEHECFFDEIPAFEDFCEQTNPVEINREECALFQEFKIHILTHRGTWVTGKAQQCQEGAPMLAVKAYVEGGTSGGPIINDSGELVGIVSNFGEPPNTEGLAPRPHLALPVWVYRKIFQTVKDIH